MLPSAPRLDVVSEVHFPLSVLLVTSFEFQKHPVRESNPHLQIESLLSWTVRRTGRSLFFRVWFFLSELKFVLVKGRVKFGDCATRSQRFERRSNPCLPGFNRTLCRLSYRTVLSFLGCRQSLLRAWACFLKLNQGNKKARGLMTPGFESFQKVQAKHQRRIGSNNPCSAKMPKAIALRMQPLTAVSQ